MPDTNGASAEPALSLPTAWEGRGFGFSYPAAPRLFGRIHEKTKGEE
jgi:hypothetical protein